MSDREASSSDDEVTEIKRAMVRNIPINPQTVENLANGTIVSTAATVSTV